MEQSVSGVGVLDKAMLIVRAAEDGPVSLGELVARTGVSRATAHRLALALEHHGLLRRAGDGRFVLGLELIGWGRSAVAALDVIEAAREPMRTLRDGTGESVQLYVRDGAGRRCVAALESPRELRTMVAVGSMLPLDRGSAGLVLSGSSAANGWIETAADREPGVGSVSAPVLDPGGDVIAAVSASGPLDRIGSSPGAVLGDAVSAAAAQISDRLAGSDASTVR